ncbi:hypothetical protein [Catenulispora rubra]|uniref:hypothetical protein n=1 Tax=Catenulispora rubra TaxID=280293 RepID=UPI0018923D25|nr:hypothetical protein [Catenulispora rubra]
MINTEDFDDMIDDEEVFAGLRRSVAGATLPTSAADVAVLGRRTRNRHRALAAGIGTSAAALVAAVGVLAPSAGTGAGGTSTAKNPVTLDIQDAGFTLQKHADGVVDLTMQEVFDPAKLQAALTKAGIKSDVQDVRMPSDWPAMTPIDCAASAGVERDEKAISEALENTPHGMPPNLGPGGQARRVPNLDAPSVPRGPGSSGPAITKPTGEGSPVLYEFRPGTLPAEDVVALFRFDFTGKAEHRMSMLVILTGMPGKCVPVPAGSPEAMKSRF